MRYFATIRIELPINSPEDAVKIAKEVEEKLRTDKDYELNPYLCHVTQSDRGESKEIINNID